MNICVKYGGSASFCSRAVSRTNQQTANAHVSICNSGHMVVLPLFVLGQCREQTNRQLTLMLAYVTMDIAGSLQELFYNDDHTIVFISQSFIYSYRLSSILSRWLHQYK